MWTCSIAATLLEHRILIIGWSIAEWQEGEKCLTEDENNIDSLQTNARSRHTQSTVWNIQDLTRFPNLLSEEAPAWAAAPDSCCVGLVKFGRPVKRLNIKEAEILEELTCELQQQPTLFFFFFWSTITCKPQKGLQQFEECYKQKVTEIQFSKRFSESEFSLLPFQVSHYFVYLTKRKKSFSFQYKSRGIFLSWLPALADCSIIPFCSDWRKPSRNVQPSHTAILNSITFHFEYLLSFSSLLCIWCFWVPHFHGIPDKNLPHTLSN